MKLYYYDGPNFGDALNVWLWPRVLPGVLDDDARTLFVGIGTLLNRQIPAAPRKVVFGSGVGYGAHPAIDDRWTVYCVRGPLTAAALGLDASTAVTDPAALLRRLPLPPVAGRGPAAFMPHYRSEKRYPWRRVAERAGLRYISPSAPVEEVLTAIRESEVLVTEAMHGAIAADALRVPWVAVSAYDYINDFKWRDWCGSLGLTHRAVRLRPLNSVAWGAARLRARFPWLPDAEAPVRAALGPLRLANAAAAAYNARRLRTLARDAPRSLSDAERLDAACDELERRLARVRADHAAHPPGRTHGV